MINNKDKGEKAKVETEDKAIGVNLTDTADQKKLEQEVEALKNTIKTLQKASDGHQSKLKNE